VLPKKEWENRIKTIEVKVDPMTGKILR